jgi:aspartate aminotransferase-like enzyme
MRRIAATGGLAARTARHAQMAEMVYAWAPMHGLRVLARENRRSPTVTALQLPEGRNAAAIVRAMEARDWLIATGLAPMAEGVIRIGHMGDLEPDHLEALLAELATVLA